MITQSPKREIVIDFPVEKVKEVIDKIVAIPGNGYTLHEKNNLFHTYKIATVKNFQTGIENITLNKIDEDKTSCVFEIYNTVGGTASPTILSSLQDNFLKVLSEGLEGKEMTLKSTSNSSCLLTLAFLVVFSTIIIFGACSKNSGNPTTNDKATLSYKVHDSIIIISDKGINIYMNKTGISGTYEYAFSGSDKNTQSQLEGFTFIAFTDSLKEGTYVFDSIYFSNSNKEFSAIGIVHDGITYIPPIDVNNGNFTLIISDYSNGLINGTFSGTLLSVNHEVLNVSEGQFKNVKVYY